MAHHRRNLPKHRTPGGRPRRMSSWPAYWDVLWHRRPARRAADGLLNAVLKDRVDPDDVAWPLGNHKPHHYYW